MFLVIAIITEEWCIMQSDQNANSTLCFVFSLVKREITTNIVRVFINWLVVPSMHTLEQCLHINNGQEQCSYQAC